MLPHGGGLTPALKCLGFVPYTFKSVFYGSNVRRHPEEWADLLEGKKTLNSISFLKDYDCVVGPPGSVLYDHLLNACPPYTKVILLQETRKAEWAIAYDQFLRKLKLPAPSSSSTQSYRACKAFYRIIDAMCVGGGFSALPSDSKEEEMHDKANVAISSASDKVSQRMKALALFEESVRLAVPPNQLLVYRIEEGWEPLCQFLGMEKPTALFPEYLPTSDNFGLQQLITLEDRFDRVRLLYIVAKLGIACVLSLCFSDYINAVWKNLRGVHREYQEAYGSAEHLH